MASMPYDWKPKWGTSSLPWVRLQAGRTQRRDQCGHGRILCPQKDVNPIWQLRLDYHGLFFLSSVFRCFLGWRIAHLTCPRGRRYHFKILFQHYCWRASAATASAPAVLEGGGGGARNLRSGLNRKTRRLWVKTNFKYLLGMLATPYDLFKRHLGVHQCTVVLTHSYMTSTSSLRPSLIYLRLAQDAIGHMQYAFNESVT